MQLMIPGKDTCPDGWVKEYTGYIVGSAHGHKHSGSYICMDDTPQVVPGSNGDQAGELLYMVETVCPSLQCEPYVNARELRCVVCSVWKRFNQMIPCVQASYVAQFRRSINNFGATAAFSAKLLTDKSIGRCDYFIFYIFLASRGWLARWWCSRHMSNDIQMYCIFVLFPKRTVLSFDRLVWKHRNSTIGMLHCCRCTLISSWFDLNPNAMFRYCKFCRFRRLSACVEIYICCRQVCTRQLSQNNPRIGRKLLTSSCGQILQSTKTN